MNSEEMREDFMARLQAMGPKIRQKCAGVYYVFTSHPDDYEPDPAPSFPPTLDDWFWTAYQISVADDPADMLEAGVKISGIPPGVFCLFQTALGFERAWPSERCVGWRDRHEAELAWEDALRDADIR